jgi:hypothetical protein
LKPFTLTITSRWLDLDAAGRIIMRSTQLLIAISLCCFVNTAVLAHKNSVPEDYPDHTQHTEGCKQPVNIVDLQTRLHDYNVARVQVADVLYNMAESYNLDTEVSDRLLSFAALFRKMGAELPQPDPGSDEFRNFDFKLGLSLTAVTVFLNSRDESLTRQFKADQNNPDSNLGIYLTRLDDSRESYTSGLENYNNVNKTGAC